MSRNFKNFFLAFILSLPFWLGINLLEKELEDLLFWQEIASNPQILEAQLISLEAWKNQKSQRLPELREGAGDFKIEAKSALSLFVNSNGQEKILFEKEGNRKLPIASLTKLMTALVILRYYDLDQIVEINKESAEMPGRGAGKLKISQVFLVKDLLYPMLMESNNGATLALAEMIGQSGFVELMNLEAKNLSLENTYFVNPTGLDPENPKSLRNYSTAEDLVKLTKNLLKEPIIWQILSQPQFNLYSADGVFHHKVINTNELLGEIPGILGGKTGYTYESGECFLLVFKAPKNKGILINVILGAKNRFEEMRNLINWLNSAYQW